LKTIAPKFTRGRREAAGASSIGNATVMINAEAEPATLAGRAGDAFSQFRQGQPDAMADLVAMLTPILWHTVRAQRLDATTTEDVLQTTWLSLVKGADKIADPRSVLQWLIVTARREAWRVSRGQSRQTPQELIADDVVSSEESPEALVLRSDTERVLWNHISKLPDRCRELLRVIAFSDRPDYAELAQSLGMPIGSIGPTRGRCLAKLRSSLTTDARWEPR
jgi:RNA polymerase sigma factor (sigma-70 family)